MSKKVSNKEVNKPLTRKERETLKQQIKQAKEMLAKDKETRPKKQLSPKQLENLAKGRALNPKFKAREEAPRIPRDSLIDRLDLQSNASNKSNGHVAVGY